MTSRPRRAVHAPCTGGVPRRPRRTRRQAMRLPRPRGPMSGRVLHRLASGAPLDIAAGVGVSEDVLGDDAQLTLWTLQQLHYRGFDDVDEAREWDPTVVRLRVRLEDHMLALLRTLTTERLVDAETGGGSVVDRLMTLVEQADGPSVAAYLHRHATLDEVLEFLRHRSIYHLKEADAQSFLLPRLEGAVKVALAELQYDEYGDGQPERLHSTLFARALEAADLDSRYGAYIDECPAGTLAVDTLISMLALRREHRGLALGQLAAVEATSSMPCRKIAAGIERVGLPPDVAAYFHEHVEADAVHEQVALRSICGTAVAAEPELLDDVLLGAAAYLELEERAAGEELSAWRQRPVGAEAS